MVMDNILEISGLNKKFESFALKDVTFALPVGYVMGFIGPNGAGKTSTIKSVLNMLRYDSGTIKLFEQENADASERIGVVMDQPFYVNEWKMKDVEQAVSSFYKNWDREKFFRLLKEFNIEQGKTVKSLSRGMKVKLMIAVALSHNAELLILDEPTSGLDPVARDELMDLLREYMEEEGRGILFSTHITSDLEKIADYITYIKDGQIIFTGLREELLERFCMIKGGAGEINAEQKKHIYGLREYAAGFEGMIKAEDIKLFPKALSEPVNLEEIIIFMNKEDTAEISKGAL